MDWIKQKQHQIENRNMILTNKLLLL